MNKEELISLKRKSKDLKEVRKELEVYKVALKLACLNFGFGVERTRYLRDFYINEAKRKLSNNNCIHKN